jgi:hypothetical protein
MTNTELSKELAVIGHRTTPEVIRKDWQKGAPRKSADAYLAWRAKRSEKTARGDPELRRLRAEKLKQEIGVLKERRVAQRRENATARGELISRAYMADRVHHAAGVVDSYRFRSEAEHPLLFAAAAGDVAVCREVVRRIWGEIMIALNSMKKSFAPTPKTTNEKEIH